MSETTNIYFDESSNITDDMFETINKIMLTNRRTFYKRHELAIVTVFVAIGCVALYMLFKDNANLLWRLTTPLVEYMP